MTMALTMETTLETLLKRLPPRKHDAHKGDFGHVLIIGGQPGMLGAVILAAQAATRSGAGLVTVATHPDHAVLVSVAQPNVMSYGVSTAAALTPLLKRASVVVLGPGLGQDEWARSLLSVVMASTLPLIVDADALNLLAQHPQKNPYWILTPHPGEAARLLDTSIFQIQNDRLLAVKQLQQKYEGVIVLKGAGTLISAVEQTLICNAGNPGMATGGMGDILSGIIGGLVAQHMSPFDAATLAVYLHAHAGDKAAKLLGERGLQPQDLLTYLSQLLNEKL